MAKVASLESKIKDLKKFLKTNELNIPLYRVKTVSITDKNLKTYLDEMQLGLLQNLGKLKENFVNFEKCLQRDSLNRGKALDVYVANNSKAYQFFLLTLDSLIAIFPRKCDESENVKDEIIKNLYKKIDEEAVAIYVKPMANIARIIFEELLKIKDYGKLTTFSLKFGINYEAITDKHIEMLKTNVSANLPNVYFNTAFSNENVEHMNKLFDTIEGGMKGHLNKIHGLIKNEKSDSYLLKLTDDIKKVHLPPVMAMIKEIYEELFMSIKVLFDVDTNSGKKINIKDAIFYDLKKDKFSEIKAFFELIKKVSDQSFIDFINDPKDYNKKVAMVAKCFVTVYYMAGRIKFDMKSVPADLDQKLAHFKDILDGFAKCSRGFLEKYAKKNMEITELIKPVNDLIEFCSDGKTNTRFPFYDDLMRLDKYGANDIEIYKNILSALENRPADNYADLKNFEGTLNMILTQDVMKIVEKENYGRTKYDIIRTLSSYYSFFKFILEIPEPDTRFMEYEKKVFGEIKDKLLKCSKISQS